MKLNRLLFTTAILSAVSVQSQTTQKKNQLEFSVGNNFGFLKNLEFAPIVMHEYQGPVYKLNYTRTSKNKNLFEVEVDYLKAELKSDVLPNLNNDYAKVGMGFSYLKKIYYDDRFAVNLGLQSQTNISIYTNKNTTFNQGDYFTVHQEFGIAGKLSYQVTEKQYLASKFFFPIVLFRVTSAAGKFYALDNYQSVLWGLEYGYELSTHIDVKAKYNFNYSRLQAPAAYQELQHQLYLGINYKF
jgi:hypothetical protein